jgi:hypothetical protein
MAKSTGPILAVGLIEFANDWLITNQLQFRVLVATGIAAGGLVIIENIPGMEPVATGIAWIALVTLMFTRIGGKPSPVDTIRKVTGL